jgi:hypothetical protein
MEDDWSDNSMAAKSSYSGKKKKKFSLLSRKNFKYNKGANSWTLIGDYHSPVVPPPVVQGMVMKKKK